MSEIVPKVEDGEQQPPLETPAAPETQAKPWWETRGFKNEAEAVAALDGSRSSLTKLQEEHAATKRTLEVVMQARPAVDPAPLAPKVDAGYLRYFEGLDLEGAYNSGDVKKYTEVMMTGLQRQIKAEALDLYHQQKNAEQIRTDFYGANKDLEPFSNLVGHFSAQVAKEMPELTVAKAMEEIARRTRAQVVAIKSGASVPVVPTGEPLKPKDPLPHTGAASVDDPPPAPPAPKPSLPAPDDVQAEIERRVALREKRSVPR